MIYPLRLGRTGRDVDVDSLATQLVIAGVEHGRFKIVWVGGGDLAAAHASRWQSAGAPELR